MHNSKLHLPGLLALFAALIILPGCVESNESRGSFFMDIAGDIEHNIKGSAVFGGATEPKTRKRGFSLILTTGKTNPGNRLDGEALYLAKLQSGRPAVGTYTVTNPDDTTNANNAFWGYARFDAEPFITFVTQTGTVTIESNEEDNISGTFQLRAVGYDFSVTPAERNEVTLAGEFQAEGGYVYIPEL